MCYEEKIIDGKPHFKTESNGQWKPVNQMELRKRRSEVKAEIAELELLIEIQIDQNK